MAPSKKNAFGHVQDSRVFLIKGKAVAELIEINPVFDRNAEAKQCTQSRNANPMTISGWRCERYKEMRITNKSIDEISGFQCGYSTKVLEPNPTKRLGPVSWHMLPVLGVKLLVVDAGMRQSGRRRQRRISLRKCGAYFKPLHPPVDVPRKNE